MGVEPALGRFYNAAECRPNANIPVVVASHGFWKRMGGRPDFVGSILQVNGQAFTVIGISPEGFSGISAFIAPDIRLPLGVYSRISSVFGDLSDIKDLAHRVSISALTAATGISTLAGSSAGPHLSPESASIYEKSHKVLLDPRRRRAALARIRILRPS